MIEPTSPGDVLHYVSSFRARLQSACEVAVKNLVGAKAHMKTRYDKKAVRRTFDPDDLVLMLVQGQRDQLGPGFADPYRVLRKVGDVNYIFSTPDRRSITRLCHINALKAYKGYEVAVCCAVPEFVEERVEFLLPRDVLSSRQCDTQARAVLEETLHLHLIETQGQEVIH